MRRTIGHVLTALVVATAMLTWPAATAVARKADAAQAFATPEALLAWIAAYRDEPDPAKLPDAVQAMARQALLRDSDRSGVYLGFVGGVLGDNQVKAPKLIEAMFPLPPEDQVVVIKGLAYSGLPNWKDLLIQFAERMPARHVHIRRFLYGQDKPLAERDIGEGPDVLDALWGFYFATGSYQPALRIVTALKHSTETRDVEKLTIGSMAKWTLANNASRDKALLDLLRAEVKRQPKEVAEPLKEVIGAAETFETTRIRKQAVAAIELLKAKGPPKELAGWAWWSQAASTAIALGCVVAGATGQVQLGLPCLIGGVASSAATKWLGQSQ